MGHTRLGKIPKSRRWGEVVATVAGGFGGAGAGKALADDIDSIAQQTLDAAQGGLARAISDAGLRHTFYVLTQVVLAAKHPDWPSRLAAIGIHVPSDGGVVEFAAAIQHAIDDHIYAHCRATDISEMGQAAAAEAIATVAGPMTRTLFGSGKEELGQALRALSTKAGFSDLGQKFFGRFMSRFLNFYLSRVTAGQVGGHRLQQVGDLTAFNDALTRHCEESARIVHDFCGEWFSKTEFREGIDPKNTSRFMAVALKKLKAELNQQRAAS
ncbi:MAG: hypothetical protein NTU53_05305 [Planctomycetota bacterium]|nr:hypothetical protein [Planctomycetota bacterium]